jgi:tRNA pseudouridine55 synthase
MRGRKRFSRFEPAPHPSGTREGTPEAATVPHGVLVVDKPAGMTSHDVVEALRRVPGVRKSGHAGTLDPMATGVLVVCVNEATKVSRFLMEGDKEYIARLRLGVQTDTQDVTGRVLREQDPAGVTEEGLREAVAAFVGRVRQVPPMYSAVKRDGVRMHVLAREGREVDREARHVEVHGIEVAEIALPEAVLRIACAKGTYIRTLVSDLGARLGCGATLTALRRTRSGDFDLAQAVSPDEILRGGEAALAQRLIPIPDALRDWRPLTVDEEAAGRAAQGQLPDAPEGSAPGERVKVMGPSGRLVALAETVGERSGRMRLRTIRVLYGGRAS